MKKTKIKTIDITALEWFDKANGNSYFAGTVTINYGMKSERSYTMPYQYGYDDCYIDQAKGMLRKAKENLPSFAFDLSMSRLCRENGIILRTIKHENCKKSELKNI